MNNNVRITIKNSVKNMDPKPSSSTAKAVVTKLLKDLRKIRRTEDVKRIESVVFRAAKIASHVVYRAALVAALGVSATSASTYGIKSFVHLLSALVSFRPRSKEAAYHKALVSLTQSQLMAAAAMLSGATLYKTLRLDAGLASNGAQQHNVRLYLNKKRPTVK